MSNRSASRSTILPLPSSPHWAPITAITLATDFHGFETDLLVQFEILLCSGFPRVINQHSVVLNLLPLLGPRIKVKGLAYFFKQSARFVRSKFESRTRAFLGIKLLDCIVQTACRAHDRNRAVAHAVHLIQTTRLKQRGHQKHVGAGFDLVRERLGRVTLVNANLTRRPVVPTL